MRQEADKKRITVPAHKGEGEELNAGIVAGIGVGVAYGVGVAA
ncbi:MAG: hypothetical protein ACPL7G_05630 [Chloroflexia bacterium]